MAMLDRSSINPDVSSFPPKLMPASTALIVHILPSIVPLFINDGNPSTHAVAEKNKSLPDLSLISIGIFPFWVISSNCQSLVSASLLGLVLINVSVTLYTLFCVYNLEVTPSALVVDLKGASSFVISTNVSSKNPVTGINPANKTFTSSGQ